MNILQLMRQARLEVDALRTGNIASALWNDEEVLKAVNIAMDNVARILRLSGSNLLTKSMRSSDANVDLISESYDPSSFQLVSGVSDYTMPTDYVRALVFLPLTGGYEDVVFRPAEPVDKSLVAQRTLPAADLISVQNSSATYYYHHLGARTVRFIPTPKDTIDLELLFHYRPAPLRYTSLGTVKRAASDATVTGTTTTWVTSGLRTPAELLLNVASALGVTMDAIYLTIASIDSDTSLELSRISAITDATGLSYYLAMVPTLPEEHHSWLAQYAGAIMLRKVSLDLSDKSRRELETLLVGGIQPEVTLRQMQESIQVEPFNLPL